MHARLTLGSVLATDASMELKNISAGLNVKLALATVALAKLSAPHPV